MKNFQFASANIFCTRYSVVINFLEFISSSPTFFILNFFYKNYYNVESNQAWIQFINDREHRFVAVEVLNRHCKRVFYCFHIYFDLSIRNSFIIQMGFRHTNIAIYRLLFFLICSFWSVLLLCPPAALNPPIDLISYLSAHTDLLLLLAMLSESLQLLSLICSYCSG